MLAAPAAASATIAASAATLMAATPPRCAARPATPDVAPAPAVPRAVAAPPAVAAPVAGPAPPAVAPAADPRAVRRSRREPARADAEHRRGHEGRQWRGQQAQVGAAGRECLLGLPAGRTRAHVAANPPAAEEAPVVLAEQLSDLLPFHRAPFLLLAKGGSGLEQGLLGGARARPERGRELLDRESAELAHQQRAPLADNRVSRSLISVASRSRCSRACWGSPVGAGAAKACPSAEISCGRSGRWSYTHGTCVSGWRVGCGVACYAVTHTATPRCVVF